MLLALLGEPPTADAVASWKLDDELHRTLLRQWRWLAGLEGDLQMIGRARKQRFQPHLVKETLKLADSE